MKQEIETELKNLTNRQPFRPFRIETLNGQSFEVSGPEVIMLAKPGLVVLFTEFDKELHLIDSDTINIVSVK
jgi:hypothetical protein